MTDLIEGVALASTVAQRVLLDAAAHLIEGIASELDDVEGIQDAGGVLELVINGVLVSLEGVQCRDLDTGAELLAALGQPVLVHGAGSAWDQVQQPGRGMVLPSRQIHDAGELTGSSSASVLVVPHVLIDLKPARLRNGQDHRPQLGGKACHFFCVCGLEVGGDPVGVGGGGLGEGLFPVGGELALDETGWGGAFAGGFALVLVALLGAFVAVAGLLATVVQLRPRRRGSDRGSWSPLRSWSLADSIALVEGAPPAPVGEARRGAPWAGSSGNGVDRPGPSPTSPPSGGGGPGVGLGEVLQGPKGRLLAQRGAGAPGSSGGPPRGPL